MINNNLGKFSQSKKQNISEGAELVDIDDNNHLRISPLKIPLVYLAVGWVVFGQILMVYLTIDIYSMDYLAKLVARIIPSVASIKNAKVFNSDLAMQHHAIMWFVLPIMLCFALAIPEKCGEKQLLIKKPDYARGLSAMLFILAVISACMGFYTGPLSLGLALTPFGFSFLSSFESFFLVVATRYFKLSLN